MSSLLKIKNIISYQVNIYWYFLLVWYKKFSSVAPLSQTKFWLRPLPLNLMLNEHIGILHAIVIHIFKHKFNTITREKNFSVEMRNFNIRSTRKNGIFGECERFLQEIWK